VVDRPGRDQWGGTDPRRHGQRKQLVLIQSALQAAKRPEEAELDQFIDEVLAT
jgi:hypothetical protein